jgi:hypothetical protein
MIFVWHQRLCIILLTSAVVLQLEKSKSIDEDEDDESGDNLNR